MVVNAGSNALLNIYRTGLQFLLQLALAHFVPPADYGLVALIAPVTLLVLLIGDFGLTTAIVRAPQLSAQELGGAAQVCAAAGGATVAVTALVAATGILDRVAPHFGLLCLGFAVVVLCALLVAVPRAMIERQLRYGQIARIESAVTTFSFAAALSAAWAGAGVWSYLVYHLSLQGLRAASMWASQRGRIALSGPIRGALPLMGFGTWVLAANIVGFAARNGDNYIVAWLLGPGALGIYAMAYQIMLFPLQTLTWPISGVLTATLSRLQDRPDLQRGAMLSTIRLVAFLGLPAGMFLFARAPLLFDVVLPARWHAVGDVAARLALAGCIQCVTAFMGTLFVARGRVGLQLVVAVANTAAVLAAVTAVAVVTRQLIAVANTYALVGALLSVWHLWLIGSLLGTGIAPVLRATAGGLAAGVAGLATMAAALWAVPVAGGVASCAISFVGFAVGWAAVVATRLVSVRAALSALRSAGLQGARLVENETV